LLLGERLTADLVDQAGHLVVRLLADQGQDKVDFGDGELELGSAVCIRVSSSKGCDNIILLC
jgi:hypothetical protein